MLFSTSLLFAHSVPCTAITKPFLYDSAPNFTALHCYFAVLMLTNLPEAVQYLVLAAGKLCAEDSTIFWQILPVSFPFFCFCELS